MARLRRSARRWRWYSVVANGNTKNLQWITANPAAMIGFSDAGAHLRNMTFYNFQLRMLKRVGDAQLAGSSSCRCIRR